jgi:sterol 3beta-glucosyltransferase
MRITILAIGSRGDVQPLIALAAGLERKGRHKVRLAAPDNFEAQILEYNLDFFSLGVNTRKVLDTEPSKAGMESGRNTLLWVWQILRSMRPMFEEITQKTWIACQDSEFVIYSDLGVGAFHAAEKLGIPCCVSSPLPWLAPTRAYPNPGGVFPALPLGGGYNWLTYTLSRQMFQAVTGPYFNRWRKEKLQLPPIPFGQYPYNQMYGQSQLALGSYSPVICPKPPDWDDLIHVTGYWILDPGPNWQPPAQLVDFLESGPPPVYIGFGSMANRFPQQTAELVQEALDLSGQRGVLATGWGGIAASSSTPSDNLYSLGYIPHTWLFPQMAAVVHHGGAGTTGTGLWAGVPSIIVPHLGDQPFWAKRIIELGVGPNPIPRRLLSADRLATAITHAVTDKDMQARAAAMGERIRNEDGIGRAIEIIEGFPNGL